MKKQMMMVLVAAGGMLACGLTAPLMAQEKAEPAMKEAAGPGLKVGDKAPAIAVGKFVKGEPITSFEKGQVYVVEFWATWCGPCIKAIPHITALQKEYKDKGVRMLGVSVWENDQSKVEPFVKEMGDKMNYTVAMDDVANGAKANDGKMSKTWMAAAGRNGIPSSFIVDRDGKVAWIGHPMELDGVLKKVVAGKFDPAKEAERAKKEAEAARDLGKYRRALQKGDIGAASEIGNRLFETFGENAMGLNQVAWFMVDPEAAIEKPDLGLAMKAAQKAADLTENKDGMILDTLARVYFVKGDLDKAIELQTKAVELAKEGKEDLQKSLDEYKAKKKGV